MFYSQVILAKKGPLAKVWLAAHWGDKKLARPQIFATDISQSCVDIMNPSVPLALRLSGHLLLGVVRIYSRKVQYVLHDCTEAMLKLQMAFSAHGGEKGDGPHHHQLLVDGASAHQLVTNFGDYEKVHVVEGFCLPLPEDNEWILAEEQQQRPQTAAQDELLLAAHLGDASSSQTQSQQLPVRPEQEEEEAWAPFDPDADDEEDDDDGVHTSRVSDIEVVRAANESFASEDKTRRSSLLLDKSTLTADTPTAAAADSASDNYDFDVPFGDDDDEDSDLEQQQAQQTTPGGLLDDSALQLSTGAGTPLSKTNAEMGLSLEDEDDDERSSPEGDSKKRSIPQQTTRKRRRKRRKVVIDNHETELTNEHIRGMLQDTDDIVRPMVHPASLWDEDGTGKDYKTLVKERMEDQSKTVSFETTTAAAAGAPPCLTRPFLADEDRLHPVLANLWQDNYWKALGNPRSYRTLEPVDEVEAVRRDEHSAMDDDDDDEARTFYSEDEKSETAPLPQGEDEEEEYGFSAPPMDDDDDGEEEQDTPVFEQEQENMELPPDRDDDGDDLLELGMVNDMVLDSDDDDNDDDDNDETREALGDTHTSATQWHKHTVRVYSHLKKCLKEKEQEEVGFRNLTKNVQSRRNAASVFFELLQLKTWDFLELDQQQAYGDITISAGIRFDEDAPNH